MNIAGQIPLESIYQSLSALNVSELDDLVKKAIDVRKEKLPNVLTAVETDLLQKINAKVPDSIQERYDILLRKRHQETLTPPEYSELLELTAYMEQRNVQRLSYLMQLSKVQNKTLEEVLQALEIKPKVYDF